MPLISVIIPVYNGEKSIKETLDSILHQTISDLEILIINDGSQDSTIEIVTSVQDPRIQIFSYPNAGLAASRNRGIKLASTDYISFIDADDLWTPDKLEAQYKALQENPQAAVAYSWTDYIDDSSQFLRRGSHITVQGDAQAKLLVMDFLENGSNALIRKQALIDVGGFDELLPAAEDWDIFLKLAAKYSFVAVPSSQILYRISANSMSANVVRQEAACLKVLDRAFTQAPESLQCLKRHSFGNLYKYLTAKALDGYPDRQRGLTAGRLFWNSIQQDPSLLSARVTVKVLLKIAAMVLLPPAIAQTWLIKNQKLTNTNTLLGLLQFDL
ncbi:MAG TPA: glycosyltransferase [Waterburya sp.]|jgi:glycosyltransferase involved in cell wall biosynthesis